MSRGGVLRRERRQQPAQVPGDAQHRGEIQRLEASATQVHAARAVPVVRRGAAAPGHGQVRTVRRVVLRPLPRGLPPFAWPPRQAHPDGRARPAQGQPRATAAGARRRVALRRARRRAPQPLLHAVQGGRLSAVRSAGLAPRQPRRPGHHRHV